MSVQDLQSDLETTPEPDERVIRRLVRALDYSRGFWLGFAKSNTPAQRRRLSALCKDLLEPLKIRVLEIELNEPVTDLLPILRERLAQEENKEEAGETPTAARSKLAIFVHGLERSIPSREAYPPLLSSLNLKRELFRQEVPHPLLLWLPDYALTALARKAPDFWAWRSGLYEFAPERDTAETYLEAVRSEALHLTISLPEQVKRERLVMLKGLLEDYRELGDGTHEQNAMGSILTDIGLTHEALGEWVEAEQALKEALSISRNLNDSLGEATALHNLGFMADRRMDIEEAQRLYNESLEISRRFGYQHTIADTLRNLGGLLRDQREFEEARLLLEESLEIQKRINDQSGAAVSMHNLAMLAEKQGDLEGARRLYEESLEIKKRIDNQSGYAITLHQLAGIAEKQGKMEDARHLLEESLMIKTRIGDRNGVAITLNNLGYLLMGEGDKEEAARMFREALDIFKGLGSPNAETVRQNLALLESPEKVPD